MCLMYSPQQWFGVYSQTYVSLWELWDPDRRLWNLGALQNRKWHLRREVGTRLQTQRVFLAADMAKSFISLRTQGQAVSFWLYHPHHMPRHTRRVIPTSTLSSKYPDLSTSCGPWSGSWTDKSPCIKIYSISGITKGI